MMQERLIGAGRIDLSLGELTWERLDREVASGFMSHLKTIDPFLLGLDEDIVSAYMLGTLRRHVGARQIGTEGPQEILRDLSRPEILVDLRALSLQNLSYQLLMPVRILQQYLDILLRQRRILVLGPPGTGKSHLVETLGQYVCLVSAPRANLAGYKLFPSDRTSLPNILHALSMSIQLESAKVHYFQFVDTVAISCHHRAKCLCSMVWKKHVTWMRSAICCLLKRQILLALTRLTFSPL